jgi:hypothetical protein
VTIRGRLAVVWCATGLVLGAVTPSTVSAQTGNTAPAAPGLTLARQDPWTATGATFTMLVQTTGDVAGLHLTLTVHDRVVSRSAFDATLADENPTFPQTLRLVNLPLEQFPPDGFGLRSVDVALDDLNIRRSGNGVYPLEVQLRDGEDDTVAGFVTHVVVADSSAVGTPLAVAWIWPLAASPALALDGTPNPAVIAELGPSGRLGRQATLIGANTDVPLTLAPNPETLESWSTLAHDSFELAAGVDALRRAVPHHQVLAAPYVRLDLPTLFQAGVGSVLGRELDRGWDALQTFFDAHIDPSTAMPGPLDATSLGALRNAARTRLIVDGDALEPFPGRLTPARPAQLAADQGGGSASTAVLATDPGIERFLPGDEPGLRAAHLLATLAITAGEQPSVSRAVAFANPASWDPDTTFVDAVLAGLRNNPLLRPVTVDTLLAETPEATVDDEAGSDRVVRVLAPTTVHRPPVTATDYYQGLLDRNGIADLFGAGDTRVQRADRVLLSVVSANYQNQAGRREALDQLHAIGQSTRGFLALIRVPDQSTVTLTSSRAQIPLTFRNDADRRVGIHVALSSSRLSFPDGADRDVVLEPGKNETVRIAVETRSSGTYPLSMTVTTAGGLPIGTSEVTVRSSFVSGVGVFLTVGALVFLALWWGWDIRRRRIRTGTAKRRAPRPTA